MWQAAQAAWPVLSPDGRSLVSIPPDLVDRDIEIADADSCTTTKVVKVPRPPRLQRPGRAVAFDPTGSAVIFPAHNIDVVRGSPPGLLVAASLHQPVTARLQAAVAGPQEYGGTSVITVKGTPLAAVSVRWKQPAGWRSKALTLPPSGKAVMSLKLPYSGVVTAAIADSLVAYGATTPHQAFGVPAKVTAVLAPGGRTVNGVTWYRKRSHAIQYSRVVPLTVGRKVVATLWVKRGRGWTVLQRLTLSTPAGNSPLATVLGKGAWKGTYRVSFAFSGDARNSAARAVTGAFRVG